MSNWIFLSKNGDDEYVNMLAAGCRAPITSTSDFDYYASNDPIVLRGILKDKVIKQCWRDQRDFYYIDTGYFGNEPGRQNRGGWKHWHRIVRNNLQHSEIRDVPADRWAKFKRPIKPWQRTGSKILIAAPDDKPCRFYGVDQSTWIKDTVTTIQQYTDRPIVIRQRNPNRKSRVIGDNLVAALKDTFALVTFNSVAATEAILNGIPAFVLAPANAAMPVAETDLSKIESPHYPDADQLYKWACHLAYGQFHIDEMRNGTAKEILERYQC